MKKKILLLSLLFQSLMYSQQDAWIYLTDKENVAASISNPITILTQKAIDRKNAQGIAIDVRDVPVTESYITQLKAQTGITVLAKSKWFNAVHVRGSEADINALTVLSFVDYIDFADKSLNTGRPSVQQSKFDTEEALINFVYGNSQVQIDMINLDNLHVSDYTGDGITIAVLDAGFPNVNTMSAFQRLRDNNDLLNGYDFVNRTSNVYAYTANSHGTLVLSDMAGFVQDQFVGTAPDASYYLFRTEDAATENPVEESYWVEAAERADSLGVNIINSSLGYTTYDNPNYSYTPSDMNGLTAFITKGANIAAEKGILVVNSAGNSGAGSWQIVGAPADAAGVFSIGGVDASGNYASFSSRGDASQPTLKPDVVAQAAGPYVINQSDNITTSNGTSFSSPIMAGAIACLMQALPSMSPNQIKQFIRQSASQYSTPDYFLGYGIPDMQMALNLALSVTEFETVQSKIYPNPVNNILYVQLSSVSENTEVTIYNVLGKVVLQQKLSELNSSIDVSSFSSGLYMLSISSNKNSKTFKLIKS